jgi:hypothetical protein
MGKAIRSRTLHLLENEWATYGMRFRQLPPAAQASFLAGQGYARLGDLLAHVDAWWREGIQTVEALLRDPAFPDKAYDVDAFNAQAVEAARTRTEEQVEHAFEETRREFLEMVLRLPPEACAAEKSIDKHLTMEVIGHYKEHRLPEADA